MQQKECVGSKEYLVRQECCHKAVQGQTIGRATFTGDARCQPDRWETVAPRHKKYKYTITDIQISWDASLIIAPRQTVLSVSKKVFPYAEDKDF